MPSSPPEKAPNFDPQDLLAVISQLTTELHPDTPPPPVTLDSSLDRDLGLDSLARMELLTRLENYIFHPSARTGTGIGRDSPRPPSTY